MDYKSKFHSICPACAATDIRLEGFGTQKIEDEIAVLFPDARVKRMDYDTHTWQASVSKIN